MDPRVYLPRIIAAAIAALLKYVGVEVGEETGITPECDQIRKSRCNGMTQTR